MYKMNKKVFLSLLIIIFSIVLYKGYNVIEASEGHDKKQHNMVAVQKLGKLKESNPVVREVSGSTVKLWKTDKGTITLNESSGEIDVTTITKEQVTAPSENLIAFEVITLSDNTKALYYAFEAKKGDKTVVFHNLKWSRKSSESAAGQFSMFFPETFTKQEIIEIANSTVYAEEAIELSPTQKEQYDKVKGQH